MESSSDGSFTWTDASDDPSEKETMAKSNKISQSGDESESGKNYKKKLQQRLFSEGLDDVPNNVDPPPQKKRKKNITQTHSESDESPKKKRIKIEPESDVDVKKGKKKHKPSEVRNRTPDSYDEDYLNSKVMDEQKFAVPSAVKVKKRKKINVSEISNVTLNNGDVSETHDLSNCELQDKSNFISQIHYEDESSQIEEESSYVEEDENSMTKSKKKKKKSKRAREKSESEASGKDGIIIDIFNAEETVVEQRKEAKQDHVSTTSDNVETILNGDLSHKDRIQHLSGASEKLTERLSERITFEEEDADVQTRPIPTKTPTEQMNKRLKTFIASNTNLRPVLLKFPNALILSDDDDIMLIKCPKNVDIEAFQDKKLPMQNKCKIKLDDQTYEGNVADAGRKITLINSVADKPVITNVSVKGYIRLHRRIPKASIQDYNTMVNNQCNFIPLPETKCRHPLFGLHYKKAIKLPVAVKERLQLAQDHLSSSKRKKKNRSKSENEHVSSVPKLEPTADTCTEITAPQTSDTLKKKKRKHSETFETEAPRQKKIKYNPDSAETWESEKAIEETLFNF